MPERRDSGGRSRPAPLPQARSTFPRCVPPAMPSDAADLRASNLVLNRALCFIKELLTIKLLMLASQNGLLSAPPCPAGFQAKGSLWASALWTVNSHCRLCGGFAYSQPSVLVLLASMLGLFRKVLQRGSPTILYTVVVPKLLF